MKKLDLNQFITLIAEPQKTQLLSASDWEILLWILDTARLEAWLFAQIKQHSTSCILPPTVVSRLTSATIYAERQQQQVRFECQTIASLLAEKQIEPLFLKGAAYVISSQFYSAGRVCSDIDALVQHNDLETSERHLKMNMWLSQEVDDYDDKYYREYAHEIPPMMQSERGTVLDLHHNLFLPVSGRAPNISQFWALRTRNENGLSTLKPAAALVHSMIHLLMNEEVTYGLRDCLDMQSIIDTHNSESFWLEVSTLVVDNDFTHEYQLLLLLLDSLFGRETVKQQILAQQITADTKTRFWLWCYRKAVMPDHPQLCNPYAGVARAAVYCRGHSQKMPLATLLKHSTVKLYKAVRKALVGEADKE